MTALQAWAVAFLFVWLACLVLAVERVLGAAS